MLEALLPQAEEAGDEVEVWILDNASTDDTPALVEQALAAGKIKYTRNEKDLGPARNITRGPASLATGEYAWVLGDHNLMLPGALRNVLTVLRRRPEIDVFYANFRCAIYPDQWPTQANGGFSGPFDYLGNAATEDKKLPEWENLLNRDSAFCTQNYAHIVRRSVWREYWEGRELPESYETGMTTYPHTWMITDRLFGSPAYYIGHPAVTIFNGAQSWGDAATMARVYFTGFPDLLRLFQSKGLSKTKLAAGRGFCSQQLQRVAQRMLSQPSAGVFSATGLLARAGITRTWMWPAIWRGFLDAQNCWLSRSLRKCRATLSRWHQYWFYNCRPARWYRQWRASARQSDK